MSNNPPNIDAYRHHTSYSKLLGKTQWQRLHPAIRKRFECTKPTEFVTYTGVMREVFLSSSGYVLAQLCRIIGTPLALYNGKNIQTTVNVYRDKKREGLVWDRHYHYPNKRTNRVKSTKCIEKTTGLIEVVGCGFGMKLDATEDSGALQFESTAYFWQIGRIKIKIPHLLTPGKTVVKQKAINDRKFEFSLQVIHPWLGLVFRQVGIFE